MLAKVRFFNALEPSLVVSLYFCEEPFVVYVVIHILQLVSRLTGRLQQQLLSWQDFAKVTKGTG